MIKKQTILKAKNRACLLLALCIITILSTTGVGFATVTSTSQPAGSSTSVYVAGNSDMFPIEYFNPNTEQYEGVAVDILNRVSKDTGIDFCYINASSSNNQKRMIRNSQVEMLSCYSPDEASDQYIVKKIPIYGDNLYIAFTGIATGERIDAISESLESITPQEIMQMTLSYSNQEKYPAKGTLVLLLAIFGALLVLLLLLLVISHILRRRKTNIERLTDSFTGIGNSEFFKENYESIIATNESSLYYIAYISFDINWVTQFLGVKSAEEKLRGASDILLSKTRDTFFLARISNDSFGLAFQSPNQLSAEDFIKAIITELNASSTEFQSVFRAGIFAVGELAPSFDEAINNARQGYLSAFSGNLPYIFCNEDLIRAANLEKQLQEQTINAVKNKEFLPYVQFIVGCQSEDCPIKGVEMVSRWQNSAAGLIGPGYYIQLMEKSGLIIELDYYIFSQACRLLEHWKKLGRSDLSVSCNFSRITMSQDDFVNRLTEITARYDFEPSSFIMEITELALESNKVLARLNAQACKQLGFRLALDDMGSGYTSFMNLCEYPIDIVKLDHSFINNCKRSEKSLSMMKSIIDMAHKLGMSVACEGVETEETAQLVRSCGSDYIQGYLYSRVIPLSECDKFIKNYEKD